jgi:hypothetical protein
MAISIAMLNYRRVMMLIMVIQGIYPLDPSGNLLHFAIDSMDDEIVSIANCESTRGYIYLKVLNPSKLNQHHFESI